MRRGIVSLAFMYGVALLYGAVVFTLATNATPTRHEVKPAHISCQQDPCCPPEVTPHGDFCTPADWERWLGVPVTIVHDN